MNLHALLTLGYFPKELPPSFCTKALGDAMTQTGVTIPKEFDYEKTTTNPAVHNLARAGALRRKLSIPNPTNFYQLAKFIDEHKVQLIELARKSKYSLTSPGDSLGPRAINSMFKLDDRPVMRAKIRSTSRFVLKADISRFYHSIYSHSIPWAIHEKYVAKSDHSPSLYGNVLDELIRKAQDGQTIGIPIGPDPSLLISEIVLGAVDQKLTSSTHLNGFRYIDDYEFGFKSHAEAEAILCLLQEVLNHFELSLNPRKTTILKLPIRIEDAWLSELRGFSFHITDKGQEIDLLKYFDSAFELSNQYPDEGILKYAIARMSGVRIKERNWRLYQNILSQCCLTEPGVAKFVIEQLAMYAQEYPIDKEIFEECFNDVITTHAVLGHGSEVAWAIFSIILLNTRLQERAIEAAANMDDPVVAILALDAHAKKLTPPNHTFNQYALHMKREDLYGEHWLLSYEANVKGWLPPYENNDHVESDPRFRFMKINGVSFYNDQLTIDRMKTKPLSRIILGGEGDNVYQRNQREIGKKLCNMNKTT